MVSSTAISRGKSLVERVVDRIGQEIVSNKYGPDVSLPNETEWCEKLGISRSVLREALRVLVSKNLITIKARLGGRIRDRSEWNQLDPDLLRWRSLGESQQHFASEVFELRRIVEPAAAELAAQRIQVPQLEALQLACQEMEDAGEDSERFTGPDTRFHRIILGAVGNSMFQGLIQSIMVALDMILRMSLDAPKGQQQSVPLHWAVYHALAKHDPAAARKAMLTLVDESARDVAEAQELLEKKAKARTAKKSSGTR